MNEQKLLDYIKQQTRQGKSKKAIKSELLKAGWQEADIDQALNPPGADSSVSPPPPPKAPPSGSQNQTPKFRPQGMQQLDPKAVWLFFIRTVLRFAFAGFFVISPFIGAVVDSSGTIWGLSLTLLVVLLVSSYVWAKLTYRFYKYELTEDGFKKELGIISKKYVTIPYGRIQNVDIRRSLLARILGVSSLNIQTAGDSISSRSLGISGAEGQLPGVSRETAEQLRENLTRLIRQNRDQGL